MSQFVSGLKTLTLHMQTRLCTTDLALHQYEQALPHCRMRYEAGACLARQKPVGDGKADNQQDLEKDAHMVPLGRFILTFVWQEELGLAAALACAKARAEEKGTTLSPGVLWQ